jgi:hypothetical protein
MSQSVTRAIFDQLGSRDDWDDFDAPAALAKPAVAIRVTEGEGDLTLQRADGSAKALPKLALNQFEPVRFRAVTVVGAGVVSYRVYYE